MCSCAQATLEMTQLKSFINQKCHKTKVGVEKHVLNPQIKIKNKANLGVNVLISNKESKSYYYHWNRLMKITTKNQDKSLQLLI